jgi:hypothetical protein
MVIKNPNSAMLQSTLILLASYSLGAMASRVVLGLVHKPTEGADEATAKKESNNLKAKRAGIVLASGYGASAVSGTDTTSQFLKGLGLGMAVTQSLDLVKDFASANPANSDTSTTIKKAKANALGLACPCDVPAIPMYGMNGMGRGKGRRSLRAVVMQDYDQPLVNAGPATITY